MRCHEVDYKIIGHDIQMLEIALDPYETVIAEAGAMTYLEQDIDFDTKMGDGTEGVMGKLWGLGKRMLTGESIFLTHFHNEGAETRHVGFAAPFPGSIIALNLAELGEEVICQRDSFLAAAFGTEVDIAFHKRLGSGFFGGEGFILQRLRGDGLAFVHAGGTVVRKELHDETLRLDTGCLIGFSGDIDYDIGLSGGLKSMFFGGEGMFLATLKGTGSVWIQSMPFSRLAEGILSHAVASDQGES
ncbi:TIGR00266 family protein [Methylomarinum sp. Ch1-1]|uniref:TIGR00266 family protein n=1 Tax=Methylomarinum roseum TaxID=3067653 RepID=A0AAU7NYW1_9GAMM|nr:TIGR00266 family protein [Methylomarinum sp. Ch1-1]MDP4521622.1 TIGR00266 family protein [Methylomarinum sp. Ch1-1]